MLEEEPTVAVLLVTSFYKSDKSITRRGKANQNCGGERIR